MVCFLCYRLGMIGQNIRLPSGVYKTAPFLLAGVILATGLYTVSLYNYLLFHTLIEVFSVLTAFVIFALAWHTRATHDNHYLLFIGIALLFAGVLDLLHLIAYKGMGIFAQDDPNLATQFWIAFRFVFSLSFLLSVFFIGAKLSIGKTFALYLAGVSALIGVILLGGFPDCYIAGTGLTRFKIVSEYVIILMFLSSLVLLVRKRHAFDPWVLRLMVLSMLFSIASELSFTEYASVYGFANMLGHLFLLASVVSIYRAIVVTAVVEPSRILFHGLKQREEAIRASEKKYRLLFENMMNGLAYHRIVCDEQGKPVDYVFLEVNSSFESLTGLRRADIIGKSVREALPGIENDPADWIGVYGRVALTGEAARLEQHAEGRRKWYSVSAYSPTPGHFVAIFEDITDRKRIEEERRHSLEQLEGRVSERTAALARANEQLEQEIGERREMERRTRLTNELLKLYTQKFSRGEYLDVAVELIRGWSGCRHTGIRIADAEGNIPYESSAGYNADFLHSERMLSLKNDQCICTRVAAGEPDASDQSVMTPAGSFCCNETGSFVDALSEGQKMRYRGVCMRFGFKSLAVVPVRHREKILGAIHIADERPGLVPPEHVEFVEQLAFIVGEALFRFGVEEDLVRRREELVRKNEQLRNLSAHMDAVREGERTSIAREIHDELGQVLTATKMDVSWLRNRLSSLETKLAEKAGETIRMIDGAIQSVKRISSDLRPGVLDDIGLAAAIEWAAKNFQKRTGIGCAVTVDPENMIVDRMRSTALFRICQESLTNIMRHAQASRVSITLSEKGEAILLSVSDNGKGINADELSSPHAFGLIGMRERVQFLHGTITIRGVPNNGTTVTVTLPVRSEKEQGIPGHGVRESIRGESAGSDRYKGATEQ